MTDIVQPEDSEADEKLANAIAEAGTQVEKLTVTLSNEVVHLLSEQLYTSPLKAIEELVVNAYDADATECRIAFLLDGEVQAQEADVGTDDDSDVQEDMFLPAQESKPPTGVIAIFDDGDGMDVEGLRDLWRIGNSPKKKMPDQVTKSGRPIIGKFGIGKLATYAVANRITYVTASKTGVHQVTCDFSRFSSDKDGKVSPVILAVHRIDDLSNLLTRKDFAAVIKGLGIKASWLTKKSADGWTLCLLDQLKPKARALKLGRLNWVLRTAMPMKSDFKIFSNGRLQVSTKDTSNPVVMFDVKEFEDDRIASLNKAFGVNFSKVDNKLIEPNLFPQGISAEILVTEKSLLGKSDTLLGRSNGFFIKVRGRLVNNEDKLFYNTALSFETFNRFRADMEIDDLNDDVTAPREGVEMGPRRRVASALAREIFNQARQMYEEWLADEEDQKLKPEHDRVFVAPRLVERPLADALTRYPGSKQPGVDADRGWFFIESIDPTQVSSVVDQLYSDRKRYRYARSQLGPSERLTKFQPSEALFILNDDHELVRAFGDDPRSKEFLNLFATSEVLLEVYMREAGIDGFVIAEVLERRDLLMRSLAQDRVYSLDSIAVSLRENFDSEHDLEMALVAAARAVGFNAKHVGGKGQPDGIARILDSTMRETTITLEAKSSAGTPSLGQLDFAGLKRHRSDHQAVGCLLVAPKYPGEADPNSAVCTTAIAEKISCWTIDQLASVVEGVERRQITARQVAEVILTAFSPIDVKERVIALLADGTDMQDLYLAIMSVFRDMFSRRALAGSQRKIAQVAGILSVNPKFTYITEEQVRRAVVDLAHASKGAMSVAADDAILFSTDITELARRVSSLTGELGGPRSLGTFRNED